MKNDMANSHTARGSEVLHNLADKYQDTIEDTKTAERFFVELLQETAGAVNVDFIDGNNYDHIEKVEFDHSKGLMTIFFILPESDEEFRQMRKMAIPWDSCAMSIRFDAIRFLRAKERDSRIGFVILGYTDNEKLIKKEFKQDIPEIQYRYLKENFYSGNHLKVKDGELNQTIGIETPIASCWIIPKDLYINAQHSQKILYRYNISLLNERIDKVELDLNLLQSTSQRKEDKVEILQTSGNRLRNIAETLLKLEVNFHYDKLRLKDDKYHTLLLGELLSVLIKGGVITQGEKKAYTDFATGVNELSHASGIPADISKVGTLLNWLRSKISEFGEIIENGDKIDWNAATSLPSPHEFIDKNFHSWSFKSFVKSIVKEQTGKCCFRIKRQPTFMDFKSLFDTKCIYLCKDGVFREIEQDDADCLVLYSREETVNLINAINDYISQRCNQEGYEADSIWIHVNITHELQRTGTPAHVFTKKEIRELMANADDSEYNQLVIDEDGHPRLNHEPGCGSLYPVSQEGWCAGNYYVGTESSLSDAEPSYRLCLEGMLFYLQTGKAFYSDCYPNIDEEDALKQIKEILSIEK